MSARTRDLIPHRAVIFEGKGWDDLADVLRAAAEWVDAHPKDPLACNATLVWEESDDEVADDATGPELYPCLAFFYVPFEAEDRP